MNDPELFDLRHRDIGTRIGFKIIMSLEKLIGRSSKVGDKPFFSAETFPWIGVLQKESSKIRREVDELLKVREQLPNFQEISKDQEYLTKDNKWKTFFLFGYGFKSEHNCLRCPETTRLIENIPGMKTAMFSILAPGKHIPAHRGPYKGVLRYHLGLKVPQPAEQCRIRVGEEFAHWQEGESILFDDTYSHEVWNETDGERVVLFMDIERPLRFPISWLNKLIIYLIGRSPFVQEAKENEIEWEKKFATAGRQQASSS